MFTDKYISLELPPSLQPIEIVGKLNMDTGSTETGEEIGVNEDIQPIQLEDNSFDSFDYDEYPGALVSPKVVDERLDNPYQDMNNFSRHVSRGLKMADEIDIEDADGNRYTIPSSDAESIVLTQLQQLQEDMVDMPLDKRIEMGIKMCSDLVRRGEQDIKESSEESKRAFASRMDPTLSDKQLGGNVLDNVVQTMLDGLCGLEDTIVTVLGFAYIPERVSRVFASYMIGFLRGVAGFTWTILRSVFSWLWDNLPLLLVYLSVYSSVSYIFRPTFQQYGLPEFRGYQDIPFDKIPYAEQAADFFNEYPGQYAGRLMEWSKVIIATAIKTTQGLGRWAGIVKVVQPTTPYYPKVAGLVAPPPEEGVKKILNLYSLTEWAAIAFLAVYSVPLAYDLGSKIWTTAQAVHLRCEHKYKY